MDTNLNTNPLPITEISQRGLDEIKAAEGFVPHLYKDPVGIVTIGYGHAVSDPKTGKMLRDDVGMQRAKELFPHPLSVVEAEELLKKDLKKFEQQVFDYTKTASYVNQEMFDALVSFQYNTGSLKGSTLLKKFLAGDLKAAALEFSKWVFGTDNSGKKVKLPGLVNRRNREMLMFLEGVDKKEKNTNHAKN